MIKVFPEKRALVLPARKDVLNLVPQAKPFDVKGYRMMYLPHNPEMVRLLYNMGVKAPEPIRFYYDWANTKPFASQIDTAALMSTHRRAFVLNEMGTGKTRAALYAFDYLRSAGRANIMLVAAPLSTLVTVWEQEIFANFHHLTSVVVYGSAAKRRKLLSQKADIYIINHDGIEVVQEELMKLAPDTVLLDELAAYRNSSTDRWKMAKPIVHKATWAWGLTGAPTPNEPTDAYGQVKLLRPDNISFSFKAFKDETMLQVSQFRWIEREDANDHVFRVMQPSIRVTRDQAFDLPPVTYSTRQIALDSRAASVYKKMYDELAVQYQAREITAANEGVKLSKLLQISAGFAYDDDSAAAYIGSKDRIKEVFSIIEGASRKVIVFAPFRYLAEMLHAAVSKKWQAALVHGDVGKSERDKIFTDFQKSQYPHVIVAHPATMAHGLTLTRADTIVWASPTMSLETYEQANARITRAGQVAHAHIVHIQATPVEAQVYARLRRRAKLQGTLLDMFANIDPPAGGAAHADSSAGDKPVVSSK